MVVVLTVLIGHREEHLACKSRVLGCWCGYLSGVRCRDAYGPVGATAIVKPHNFLPHVNQDWFYLSGTQVVLEKRLLNRCSTSSSRDLRISRLRLNRIRIESGVTIRIRIKS